MRMLARLSCVALFLLYLLPVEHTLIIKTENGYSGIVVALHKSIQENTELLLQAMALFKDSSPLLYNVTKGQAFFGDITIVIPMSWNSTTVQRAISELRSVSYETTHGDFFREADIKIDPRKNPEMKDAPYTLQTGGCFESGQYIHVTPEFVLDEFKNMSDSYGPRDLSIAHEWMHLRYGIFDEYGTKGDEDFPLFYFENGMAHLSACDRNIEGYFITPRGQKCKIDRDNHISEECDIYPNLTAPTAKASIMSLTYLDSIEEFCDKDIEANEGHRHNSKAPTKQNYYCDGLSVWEVLDRHPDFAKTKKWQFPYVSPKFRILQPLSLDTRIVLVLDVSLSMMGEYMKILHTAGTIFVEDLLPDDSYIGIVKYSTDAETVQDLVKINSGNRKEVSGKIPIRAGGSTSIGSGLLKALEVLKNEHGSPEGATIVLMTDGEENKSPRIKEVLPKLVEAKVRVHTLAFGTRASELLENVSMATKGKNYFLDTNGGVPTADLKNIFGDTITIQADVDLQSEQIFREQLNITNHHQNVLIDRELGNNTLFMVSGNVASVNIELTSPDGVIYNNKSKEYEKDERKGITQFRIPVAETGTWSIAINNSAGSAIELLVTSAPKNADEQPVRAHAWLSDIQIQYPDVPRIFARVTKGPDVVIHAEVQATVRTPKGVKKFNLTDDGSGADKLRNDGIYSGYFIPTDKGRYSVFARVLNSGSALVKKSRTFSRTQPIPKENINGRRLNEEPSSSFDLSYFVQVNEPVNLSEGTSTEDFTRIADGGSFIVEGFTASLDKIPPNRVNDLHVISINITDKGEMITTLQWTSPGDDMTEGNATQLDIRVSKTDQSLRREHFQQALRLNESHAYLNDSLEPAPGRTLQTLTVFIPTDLELNKQSPFDLYFALKAADKASNWGNVSNIAVGHYGYIIPEPGVTTTDMTNGSPAMAIGVSIGVTCLAIACVLGLIAYRRKNRAV